MATKSAFLPVFVFVFTFFDNAVYVESAPAGYNLHRQKSGIGYPLILVPGDGGSQLEAKLNRSQAAHYICAKQTKDFYTLYLNFEQLLPPLIVDCWVENMQMQYDNVTRKTRNNDGVEIRVPGFGDTESVEYLDPAKWWLTTYFHEIVNSAVAMGYTRGKNIRGAPYDFRRSPNEFEPFYQNITKLIEDTYYQNDNKKVLIIAHSMGNPVMLYLYQRQPQAWKDKFIRAHVSIGGPWGGSVKTLKLFASGYNLDHYRIIMNPLTLRPFQRSMSSSAYLMPSNSFWAPNETLINSGQRNYTVLDYRQFFQDIGFEDGWSMYQDTKDLYGNLEPPGVEVHCLCGTQMSTPASFVYAKNTFPDTQPLPIYGDGDGTVNLRSLQGCLRWVGKQRETVFYKEFPKEEHLMMLSSPNIIAYLKTLMTSSELAFKFRWRMGMI